MRDVNWGWGLLLAAIFVGAGCGGEKKNDGSGKAPVAKSTTEREYEVLRRLHRDSRPREPDRRKTDPQAYSYWRSVTLGTWERDWYDSRRVEQHAIDAKLTLNWQCQVEDISNFNYTICGTPPSNAGRFALDARSCGIFGPKRQPAHGSVIDVRLARPTFSFDSGFPPTSSDDRFQASEYGVLVVYCGSDTPGKSRLLGTATPESRAAANCEAGQRDACRAAGQLALKQDKATKALDFFEQGCALANDTYCFADAILLYKHIVDR